MTWYMAAGAPVAALVAFSFWQPETLSSPPPVAEEAIVYSPSPVTLSLPILVSQKDRTLYQHIVRAQKKGQWQKADGDIMQLSDRLLVGHMLAERYLDRHYKSSPAELAAWVGHYADHPQVYDIYSLLQAKGPALKSTLPALRKPAILQGYGDDNGLGAGKSNAFPSQTWNRAISAWRKGSKAEAARLFSAIAKHPEDMSPWQASAVSYWAWRAYSSLGNKAEAQKYLLMAAREPRSFYGILARKQLHQPLGLDAKPVTLTESDILEMVGDPPVRRIIALAQSGLIELAEKELRALFPRADDQDKLRLLALAHHFNLASVQISMARHLDSPERPMDYAKYPIPHWQPQDGFKVDPALIYALVRQESGFRVSAASPVGALGLMQLMPQTASLMHRHLNEDLRDSSGLSLPLLSVTEPRFNMMLGQNYIRHLLDNELVEGNLLYMLAAYNAGPGRLQEWKKTIDYRNDPLLFIESIPYAQTRHYVMQVMANYWIYSELAGTPSKSIHALLSGIWPNYDAPASTATAG